MSLLERAARVVPDRPWFDAVMASGPSGKGMYMGPYIVGFIADTAMLGALLSMVVTWYRCKAEEGWRTQLLVVYLTLICIVGSGYVFAWIWTLFVIGYGTFYSTSSWSSWFYLLDSAVRVPTIAFFGNRAWRFVNCSKLFAGVLILLCIGCLIGGLAAKITDTLGVTRTSVKGKLIITKPLQRTFINFNLGCELAADVMVTVTMIVKLVKSKTGWSQIDALITRIMRLVAETQLPPTIVSLAVVLIVSLDPTSTLVSFFVCSHKIYALCVLTVLLSKYRMRAEFHSTVGSADNKFASKGWTQPSLAQVQAGNRAGTSGDVERGVHSLGAEEDRPR